MINDDKELIQVMKTIRLSEAARERVRAELSAYADLHAMPVAGAHSFDLGAFVMAALIRSRPFAAGALAVLIALGTGSSATFAAESALPGEALYPVKVLVNEPVAAVFAGSGEAKARYHAKLAVRRVEEAVALEARGALTTDVEQALAVRFEAETEKAVRAAEKLESDGDVSASIAIRTELAEQLALQEFVAVEPEVDAVVLATADTATEVSVTEEVPVEATRMMATGLADTEVAEAPKAPARAKQAPQAKAVVLEAPSSVSLRARVARTLVRLEEATVTAFVPTARPTIESFRATQKTNSEREATKGLLTGSSVQRTAKQEGNATSTASSTEAVSPQAGTNTLVPEVLRTPGKDRDRSNDERSERNTEDTSSVRESVREAVSETLNLIR